MKVLVKFVFAALFLLSCKNAGLYGSGGRYNTGSNRNSGNTTKDDAEGNSAFGDGQQQGVHDVLAIGESVNVMRVCSDNYTERAGTNLKRSTRGAVLTLYPIEGNTSPPIHLHDQKLAEKVRNESLNYDGFNIPLGQVPDGAFQLVMCDSAYAQTCRGLAEPLPPLRGKSRPGEMTQAERAANAVASQYWAKKKGVLGASKLKISGKKIQKIESTYFLGMNYSLMEVVTDRNLGPVTTENSLLTRMAKVQGADFDRMSYNDLSNIQDCDVAVSPLLIDLGNKGISFSPPFPGVAFDLDANGAKENISWPLQSDTPFLVLDLNDNGVIDSGAEMFGNHSPGPDGQKSPNGFLALARYDLNHDRVIDSKDDIYTRLRLWVDGGDGLTQTDELKTLASQGVESIDLSYSEADERDVFGNKTLQRSAVRTSDGLYRMIVDIWFRVL